MIQLSMLGIVAVLSLLVPDDPVHGQQQDPVVIFIHGRGQMDKTSTEIIDAWSAAFERGQQSTGRSRIPSGNLHFITYQDLFQDGRDSKLCTDAQYAAGGIGERLMRVVKGLADALVKVEGVATAVAERFLRDTREYLGRSDVRCAVNRRLVNALTTHRHRPIVLVAHSMGGLVAMNVLSSAPGTTPAHTVNAFITLGSQLRVPEMVQHLTTLTKTPFHRPPGFGRWFDFRGANDLVSPGSPRGVWTVPNPALTFQTIDTGASSSHDIAKYLSDTTVVRAIQAEWCRAKYDGAVEC